MHLILAFFVASLVLPGVLASVFNITATHYATSTTCTGPSFGAQGSRDTATCYPLNATLYKTSGSFRISSCTNGYPTYGLYTDGACSAGQIVVTFSAACTTWVLNGVSTSSYITCVGSPSPITPTKPSYTVKATHSANSTACTGTTFSVQGSRDLTNCYPLNASLYKTVGSFNLKACTNGYPTYAFFNDGSCTTGQQMVSFSPACTTWRVNGVPTSSYITCTQDGSNAALQASTNSATSILSFTFLILLMGCSSY